MMIKKNNMMMTLTAMMLGVTFITGCGNILAEKSQSNTQADIQITDNQSKDTKKFDFEYKDEDYYTDWKDEEVCKITLKETEAVANGKGVKIEDSKITITNEGTYVIEGKLSDGQIVVDCEKKAVVRLILNGVDINSKTSAPIYVKSAKKVILSLEEGTINKLSDSNKYQLEEGNDEPDATLFSKDDLTINGKGTLEINANYNDGVKTKDELKIMEGTLKVVTKIGDGIKGKDMVVVKNGNLTINSAQDGIKSTNNSDEGKGFIYIEDGCFDITSGNDGFQAETDIQILNGSYKLNTGGGSVNGKTHINQAPKRGGKPQDEGKTKPLDAGMTKPNDKDMAPPIDENGKALDDNENGSGKPQDEGTTKPLDAGMTKPNDKDMAPPVDENGKALDDNENGSGTPQDEDISSLAEINDKEETQESQKGIKAQQSIVIYDGTFDMDTADDALHCNNDLNIEGGIYNIATGDDGLHADKNLVINNGNLTITKSYEGLEAQNIIINDGKINIIASDDGVNAASKNNEDTTIQKDRQQSQNAQISINGGYIYIEASGDGIDSNGSISMTGGTAIVDGPTSNGDGALDYETNFDISGGLLIASGSSGMAQTPDSTSTQPIIAMTFSTSQKAGQSIALMDESGKVIAGFTPSKAYQSVIISSPKIKKDSNYSFAYGGKNLQESEERVVLDGDYQGEIKKIAFKAKDTMTYLSESGIMTEPVKQARPEGMKPKDEKKKL